MSERGQVTPRAASYTTWRDTAISVEEPPRKERSH